MQRVQRNQPSVPHPAGAGQSGGEQAWEMFLFSELKAQKNKSSQEKKKKKDSLPREVLSQSHPCH